MTDAISKVGFIGLGSMGGDQARELARLPCELTVYDIHPPSLRNFAGLARLAGSMAEVGEDADIVGICVRNDTQVLECADALLPVMKPGSILMIHSTIEPKTARDIHERAAALGIAAIDAPVSRTERPSQGPFVFCMTGGDEAAVARAQHFIDAFATDTIHVGPPGSAMALKIANNLVAWCAIAIGAEAAGVARAAGVPIDKLLTVMRRNGNLSPPMQDFLKLRDQPATDQLREFIASQVGIGEKDLSLAEDMAAGAGIATPIATTVRSALHEAMRL